MATPNVGAQLFYTGLVCLLLHACSTAPTRAPITTSPDARPNAQTPSSPHQVLQIAQRQIGVPYRYGGEDRSGFDCSGLVHYVYRQVGIALPRTTKTLWQHATPISRSQLRPGDLVFFRIDSRKATHVGIYMGDQQFIHAPSAGKRVRIASLQNKYWQKRLLRGGRVL